MPYLVTQYSLLDTDKMKILCVGRNYADHAKELNNPLNTEPVIFSKPQTALLKDGQPFYYPDFSKNVHYEGELVIKISKHGKNISEKFARKYYNEISFGIDFTARDLQDVQKAKGLPWEIAKAFDGSAVIGSFTSLDGVDTSNIKFSTQLNGNTVQQDDSSMMLFTFDKIIAYVSRFFTLQTGDLIYTGTPAGVGSVVVGDKLEGFIGEERLLVCEVR